MKKIILFFPKAEEKEEKAILLPASLLMVAGPLVETGYPVRIIDQRTDDNWQRELINELAEEPLVFGVSALTGRQILNGLAASKLVKEKSQVPVVWGGVHASLLPEETLANKHIDFVVVGEGEETFFELVKFLENPKANNDLSIIKGLGFKKEGQIIINGEREFIDLNNQPKMPYQLIKMENYISKKSFASGHEARNLAFYTSRGCPHRCGFCYNQKFSHRRWRGRSAEKVVADIKELVEKYKINALEIEDDEFFVDPERARRIAELIIENNIQIEIFSSSRVNYVAGSVMNDEYFNLLYRAGFRTLAFGVESGSLKILKLINKDITVEQVFTTIEKLNQAKINSKYYFMAGFPDEKREDLYQTTDLIQKMKKADPQIRIPAWRIYTPYPGTDLYNEAIKCGWQPPKTLEAWADYDFSSAQTPWLKRTDLAIIKNAAFLIDYLEMARTKGQGIFFKLAKIFGRLADWRWQNHYFSFLPEKYLVNLALRIKRGVIRPN